MWRSILSIPSPLCLEHRTRDRLLRKHRGDTFLFAVKGFGKHRGETFLFAVKGFGKKGARKIQIQGTLVVCRYIVALSELQQGIKKKLQRFNRMVPGVVPGGPWWSRGGPWGGPGWSLVVPGGSWWSLGWSLGWSLVVPGVVPGGPLYTG